MATICQSCGLSQAKETDWGTEPDGSRRHDYCIRCYVEGKFTELSITIDEMSQRLNQAMKKLGFTKRSLDDEKLVLSTLRRWREKVQLKTATMLA